MKKLLLNVSLLLILILSSTSTSANDNETNVLAPPDNDLIENAINLGYGPLLYIENDVNFIEATDTGDGGQQGGCSTGSLKIIWYKFTATKTGVVSASITTENLALTTFYSALNENATDASELTFIDTPNNSCDFNSPSSIETQIGITYYVAMRNNENSDLTIDVTQAFDAPVNDHITNAINIGNETQPYIDENIHFLMATNTDDNGEAGCDSGTTPVIWYKFTAEQEGIINVFITENGEANAAIVYTADDLNASSGADLTFLDSEPVNICGASNDAVVDGIGGQSYYILVGSNSPYVTVGFDISTTLATSENSIDGFSYYPNPVENIINLKAASIIDSVTLFNLLGQEVYSEEVNSISRNINLSQLAKGIYIMKVSSEGISESFKIIKE